MITLETTKREHIDGLIPGMLDEDLLMGAREIAEDIEGNGVSALNEDGQCVGLAVFSDAGDRAVNVCLIGSDEARRKHALSLVLAMRRGEELLQQQGYRIIQSTVKTQFPQAMRLSEIMGFTPIMRDGDGILFKKEIW